jgi:hypothetical protein
MIRAAERHGAGDSGLLFSEEDENAFSDFERVRRFFLEVVSKVGIRTGTFWRHAYERKA